MPAKTSVEVNQLFEQFVNAANLDGLVALYEPGATLVVDGGLLVGHDAIRAYLGALVEMKATIDMGAYTVIAMGDDLAIVHHDWRATATGPDAKPVEMTGKATEVVRRQSDGSWLFLFDDPDMRG